ncbi:MAG: type II toxin-antitoxin system RelE/ParE family toxin [Dehalococcoidia bacterium]
MRGWLREASRPRADRFERAMKRGLRQIREFPEAGSPDAFRGVRSVYIFGFDYALVYVIEDRWATIIAVAHTSRRPGYWRDNLD